MAKREKLFSKIVVIVFLVLIVLGFTVPGFIGQDNQIYENLEPRLCQNDADCYLLCDDNPTAVLCSQNLCQQNSCEEFPYYPFQSEPITFTLAIKVDGVTQNLENRKDTKDLFVFLKDENTFKVFTSGLSLAHILSKFKTAFDLECLYLGEERYCNDGEKVVQLRVNGNKSFEYQNYAPLESDVIEILYIENGDEEIGDFPLTKSLDVAFPSNPSHQGNSMS
jgi:hypothetical protein